VHRRLAFAVLILAALAVTVDCQKERTPDRWLIPDGYEGWIRIDYIVKNALSLPFEDGYRIIQPSPEGYVGTSSELQEGWAKDQFLYVNGTPLPETGWGEGGKVWSGRVEWEVVCSEPSKPNSECHSTGRAINQCYFIGTEKQFKAASECGSAKWPALSADDRIALPQIGAP
jgi:hypothetical protein